MNQDFKNLMEAVGLIIRDLRSELSEAATQSAAKQIEVVEAVSQRLIDSEESIAALKIELEETRGDLSEADLQTWTKLTERFDAALAAIDKTMVDGFEQTEQTMTMLAARGTASDELVTSFLDKLKVVDKAANEAELSLRMILEEHDAALADQSVQQNDLSKEVSVISQALDEIPHTLEAVRGGLIKAFGDATAELEIRLTEDLTSRETNLNDEISQISQTLTEFAQQVRDDFDAVNATAVEAPTAIEEMKTTMLEAIVKSSSDLEARLTRELAIKENSLSGEVSSVSAALNEFMEQVSLDFAAAEAQMVAEFGTMVADAHTELAKTMMHTWASIDEWTRGAAAYAKFAIVRHNNGLWQAGEVTKDEPGPDTPWVLLVDGVVRILTGPSQPGESKLAFERSSGIVDEIAIPTWRPKFLKTWDKEHNYDLDDSVLYDRHRWIAVKDLPSGPPNKSDDWALYAMQGSRGRKGEPGPEGDIGPTIDLDVVADVVEARLETGQPQPGDWWSGSWEYGRAYLAGKAVRHNQGLWFCLRDNDGTTPPGKAGSTLWELMLSAGGV